MRKAFLIDEIDKAEADVPNGLLEALGSGRFRPIGIDRHVEARKPYPLVVITTNEERALPDAFLRRCVVLDMKLPGDEAGFLSLMETRGREHFRDPENVEHELVTRDVRSAAAKMTWDDRVEAKGKGLRPPPGQAEYMDLLRALHNQRPGDAAAQLALLAEIRPFLLQKHGDTP